MALSLVWKDLVAAKWFLLAGIPLFLAQLAAFAYFGPAFLLASLLFAGSLAFGSILMEEVQNTECLWNSLPLTRGAVVLGRYLSTFLGIVLGLGLSWAVGQATARLIPAAAGDPAPFVSLHAHGLLFATLALAAAAFLPFYFRCGAGRGLILFSAVSVGVLLAVSVLVQVVLLVKGHSNPLLDPQTWKEAGPALQSRLAAWLESRIGRLLALLAGFSACAMVFSSLVSRRLYETRDL